MASNRGGVHGDLSAQAGNQRLEMAGEMREYSLYQVGMVGEALDEAVEGGAVRERPCEPAEGSELGVVLQSSDERVGVRQVQDEGGDVGPPEGLERIALASYGSVLLQTGQERISHKLAKTADSSPRASCAGRLCRV